MRVLGEPGEDVGVVHLAPGQRPTGGTLVCAVVGDDIRCYAEDRGEYRPLDTTVVPERADVFDRVRGVFETDILRDRSVAVLGLGSGGSVILRELARSGVGRFLLVDHDRLEIGNVCRHECGLSDVGRLKTNAAADLVLDRNPDAEITLATMHIDGDSVDKLSEAIDSVGADLVVCATDNRASRLLVNRLCVLDRLPALFAGVFRRAYGGQVLRFIPGLTPCYQCFVSALPSMAADHEVSSPAAAGRIAYSDRPVAVEPGLSSDIAPIALLVAKLAVQELLNGTPTTLDSLNEDLVAPLYLWLNRREVDTEYAGWLPMATGVDEMSVLRWYGIGLARNGSCAACGDMSVEGVSPDTPLDVSAFASVQDRPR
jgi:molybdopterin/thiamine biosynthesis adenylyltransferase